MVYHDILYFYAPSSQNLGLSYLVPVTSVLAITFELLDILKK